MTNERAIQDQLTQLELHLGRGQTGEAGILLDKILRLDFTNARAWQMLYQMVGKQQPFRKFQRDFAQKYYPRYAHLLNPQKPASLHEPLSPEPPVVIQPQAPRQMPEPLTPEPPPVVFQPQEPMQMPEPRTPELPPVVFQPQAPRQMPEPLTPEPPPVETIPDASLWFPEPFSPVPPEVVLVPQEPITTPQKPADGGGNGATGQALICPNCGRSNLTDARLCAYCGYAFQPITPAPAPQEDQKAGSHKERFRLKFVDLGVFVLVVSLILPWASIYRNTLFGDSSDIYNAFGAISGFGGGAGINITVLLFIMLSVAAVILVHTKQKVLAVLAGLGGLAVQIYTTVTLSGLSGQSSGDAGIFFDLSTLTMKGGVFVGLAAAVLILIGAIIS